MTVKYYELAQIHPNPWQPRTNEDPDHIRELAVSIAADGLLQIPIGREIQDATGMTFVELAAGHSRQAAFRLLAGDGHAEYQTMPVSIRELDDEQMFRIAVAENVQRRDLTPIEAARAMERYRTEFGKTSAQIGELFGLSDSAVRNKIRLLGLPEGILSALEDGRMSEGAGRALLTLFDLPEDLRKSAKDSWSGPTQKQIVSDAMKGAKAEEISDSIDRLVQRQGQDLSAATWKFSDTFEGKNIHHPDCKTCPLRFKHGNKSMCLAPKCFEAKRKQARQTYMQTASQASGYPIGPDGVNLWQLTDLHGDDGKRLFKKAKKDSCPNLGLVLDNGSPWSYNEHVRLKSHPDVEIVCTKRSGHCTCKKALEAGINLAPKNGELKEADLKAARAEIKADQRRKWGIVKSMEAQARDRINQALANHKFETMRMILGRAMRAKFGQIKTEEQLWLALSEHIIHDQTSDYNRDEVEKWSKRLNELLAESGLELVNVSADTVAAELLPQGGI